VNSQKKKRAAKPKMPVRDRTARLLALGILILLLMLAAQLSAQR
jgi:hypothetical protein